jgi:multidrug efflux system outer membrane protein
MIRKAWILVFAAAGGCAVGPNYHRPAVAAPARFRGQAQAEDRSLADQPWWDLFHDPVLTALIRAGLTEGYDARIAATRVQEARALEAQTRGQLFPALGYAGNADRGKNALLGNPYTAGNGATASGFDGYVGAAWELDIWGRVRRLDEVARDRYLATEEAQRGVRLSLVAEVASAYFDLLELDEELAISHRAADSFAASLKLFDERLRGGVASKLETASAEAAQAASAAQIPALERQIALQENALSVLLGRPPGPIARGEGLSAQLAVPEIPAGLPSALLERRPDVRQSEYTAQAANAQIGVTIGSFLPRIGLSALLGGVSSRLQDVTTHQAALWSVGAQVTGPLVQGGALHGEYLQVKAAWEEAKLEYQQAALNAFQDVANALVTRQKLAQVRFEQEREVRAGEDAVTIARERYKAGQSDYYEVLQSQEQLFPAEASLAATRRDELIAVVQLYKALGGGWNTADDSHPPAAAGSQP